jgi:hypothetical protein
MYYACPTDARIILITAGKQSAMSEVPFKPFVYQEQMSIVCFPGVTTHCGYIFTAR